MAIGTALALALVAAAPASSSPEVGAHGATGGPWTLQRLLERSKQTSPSVQAAHARLDAAEEAARVAKGAFFPVLRLSQTFSATNNPVEAFGAKLTERQLAPADLAIDALNDPGFRVLNQTSASILVPIYAGGTLSAGARAAEQAASATREERAWVRKQVAWGVYSAHDALAHLAALTGFLRDEQEYLQTIIDNYQPVTPENRNLFLSYNQARLIQSAIAQGLSESDARRRALLASLSHLVGAPVQAVSSEDPDPLASVDWSALTGASLESALEARPDLKALAHARDAQREALNRAKGALLPNLFGVARHQINTEKFDSIAQDELVALTLAWSIGFPAARQPALERQRAVAAERALDDARSQARAEILSLRAQIASLQSAVAQGEARHQLFRQNKELLTRQYRQGSAELYNLLQNFQSYLDNYAQLQALQSELSQKRVRYADYFGVTL